MPFADKNKMRSLLAQSSAGNQPATPTRSPATTAPSSPASKENQRSAIAPQGKGNAVVAPPKVLAAAAAASPAVVGPTLPAGDEEDNPRSWRSWKTGELLTPWETQVLNKPDVKRKANVAQLYFLNYYFDSLRYLSQRKARASEFEQSLQQARDEAGPAWSQTEEAREVASYNGRERALLRKRRTKLRLAQFHIITQVGQGGYGEVFLARKKETGEVCALKKLKKKVLVKTDEAHHVLVERDILTATRTPWLVKLLYAFQDPEYVYLAMEYVPGGDFRTLLNKSGVLREQHARFYAAEMFVAVNELHKLGYLHRDLKPENFLIDATGHIKLTDFGLASGALNPGRIASLRDRLDKVKDTDFVYRTPLERRSLYQANSRQYQVEAAKSIVGSPDYMAPEVLRAKSTATYGVGADYWSLGCILYEFLCGFPPFTGRSPDETWANLKNWKRVLQRPVYTKAEDLQFNLTDIAWDAVTRYVVPSRFWPDNAPFSLFSFLFLFLWGLT